jgi:hypothetical protein
LKPVASAPYCRAAGSTASDFSLGLGRQFEVESAKGRIDGRGVDV